MKNQQQFKTKTARILDSIISHMGIVDCKVDEDVSSAHTVELWIAPKHPEDASVLIGKGGKTFPIIKRLLRFVAHREEYALRLNDIIAPKGQVFSRGKPDKLPLEAFVDLAQEIGDLLFDESRAFALDGRGMNEDGHVYEIALELKTSIAPKTYEETIADIFKVIGMTREVQVGFSLVANPNLKTEVER